MNSGRAIQALTGNLSRRGFLIGVPGAVILASVSGSPDTASAAVSFASTPKAIAGMLTARTFSSDWALQTTTNFPRSWQLPKGSVRQGLEMSITWDSRLFELSDSVMVDNGEGVRLVDLDFVEPGLARFSVGAGVRTIHFSPAVKKLYPLENIDSVTPVKVSGIGESQLLNMDFGLTSVPVTAWGAELAVAWGEVDGIPAPYRIQVKGTGPHAVPAGTTIVVTTPSSIAADELSSETDGVGIESRRAVGGRRSEVVVGLELPLEPGEVLTIDRPTAEIGFARPDLQSVPTVVLRPPKLSTAGVRESGSMQSAPVTDSGAPLSDFSASKFSED